MIRLKDKKKWFFQEGKWRLVKTEGSALLIKSKNSRSVYRAFPIEQAVDLVKRNIVSGNNLAVKVPPKEKAFSGLEQLISGSLEVNCKHIIQPIYNELSSILCQANKCGKAPAKVPGSAMVVLGSAMKPSDRKSRVARISENFDEEDFCSEFRQNEHRHDEVKKCSANMTDKEQESSCRSRHQQQTRRTAKCSGDAGAECTNTGLN